MVGKLEFRGTGGALFVKFLVGALLTGITLGIYLPWFVVGLTKYLFENTTLKTERGDLQLAFTGTGGQLFVVGLVGYLLTLITFGIYGAWFLVNLAKFNTDHSSARAADGRSYRLRLDATGGALFVTFLVGALLTVITFGIYTPWFICRLQKFFLSRTAVVEGTNLLGGLDFVGTGGDLFVTFLVGYLLTIVTIGIYMPWFQVKLFKFMNANLRATLGGRTFAGDFTGTGGQYFVTLLVGYLLTLVTFGIYGAWFFADLMRFQVNHTTFNDAPALPGAMPMRALTA